jgi:hypothetical protein
MPPHNSASNDAERMDTRAMFGLSLAAIAPRTSAMSIAWDEAAECLARRDTAGFDAAMRIFKRLRQEKGL